ncbi:hypothetical protein BLOT_012361, partial [Blomia tropicalis]
FFLFDFNQPLFICKQYNLSIHIGVALEIPIVFLWDECWNSPIVSPILYSRSHSPMETECVADNCLALLSLCSILIQLVSNVSIGGKHVLTYNFKFDRLKLDFSTSGMMIGTRALRDRRIDTLTLTQNKRPLEGMENLKVLEVDLYVSYQSIIMCSSIPFLPYP